MTVLQDIDRAAHEVATGMAGDIIPVAPNFNIVRVARKNGGEYRVYSYRTFVASVFREWGAERGGVYVAGGAFSWSATTSRHLSRFISGVVNGRVDWERLKAMCEAAGKSPSGGMVLVPMA